MRTRATPINRKAKEHTGIVESVNYFEAESGFVIARLTDQFCVKGFCDSGRLTKGNAYTFMGRWEEHVKYGFQFSFETYVVRIGHSEKSVVDYLTKNVFGIGPAIAKRIWEEHGSDSIRVMREQPGLVIEAGYLSEPLALEAAETLKDISAYEETTVALYGLLSGKGFGNKAITAAITAWGAKAADVISRDPYRMLIKQIPRAGYSRCSRLYEELGLNPAKIKRQTLCCWDQINNNRHGHTWVDGTWLADFLTETIGPKHAEPVKALKLGLRVGLFAKRKNHEGILKVTTVARAVAEQQIADKIAELRLAPNRWPKLVRGDLTEHQLGELTLATREPIGILSGSPGTGKTYSLARLLAQVIKEHGRNVLLCAPTGKAAVRMAQSLRANRIDCVATSTIHRALGITRNGHDGEGWGFVYNADEPLPYKFVIVDEVSMVDTSLMADLLSACSAGTHVLLIGDPYQLPPVGHGAPLRDLIEAGVARGELTEVRRNAGQIVHGCLRIKNGESFDTCDEYKPSTGENLRLIESTSSEQSAQILERFLTLDTAFDPVWQTQVIVATNEKSTISRKQLNERLHKLLNPEGHEVKGNLFRVGDKIICLRNCELEVVRPGSDRFEKPDIWDAENYMPVIKEDEYGDEPPDESTLKSYIANGEIGRVEAISRKATIARFSEADSLVKIPNKGQNDSESASQTEGSSANFDLAYAITAHKSQGSESPCVIVMIDENAGPIANREWVYTAISRARDLCVLIGSKLIIEKQARRRALVNRQTCLTELVCDAIDKTDDWSQYDV